MPGVTVPGGARVPGTAYILDPVAAAFNIGASVYLGAGNAFTNDGTMSPGGIANVFTSAVTGNLAQSSTGVYTLDLDFAPNTADRINVSGTGSMAGKVAINVLNKSLVLPGSHQLTIVSTGAGATNAGLERQRNNNDRGPTNY